MTEVLKNIGTFGELKYNNSGSCFNGDLNSNHHLGRIYTFFSTNEIFDTQLLFAQTLHNSLFDNIVLMRTVLRPLSRPTGTMYRFLVLP